MDSLATLGCVCVLGLGIIVSGLNLLGILDDVDDIINMKLHNRVNLFLEMIIGQIFIVIGIYVFLSYPLP